MIVLDTDPLLDYYEEDVNGNRMYSYNGVPLTGTIRSYYMPGGTAIEIEHNYVDGFWWGVQRTWHPNGQLIKESHRGAGGFDGWSRTWDEQGDLIYEVFYDKGDRVDNSYWHR
jgi:antitoxin component YwqK of YwqJK toxin-antitoxin module